MKVSYETWQFSFGLASRPIGLATISSVIGLHFTLHGLKFKYAKPWWLQMFARLALKDLYNLTQAYWRQNNNDDDDDNDGDGDGDTKPATRQFFWA